MLGERRDGEWGMRVVWDVGSEGSRGSLYWEWALEEGREREREGGERENLPGVVGEGEEGEG